MSFLKKKAARLTAAVTAFILVLCAAYVFLDGVFDERSAELEEYSVYLRSMEANEEANSIADWAWRVAVMYNREQSIKEDSFFKKNLKSEMQRLGLTDSSGKLILPQSENFYYYVDINGSKYSNNANFITENVGNEYMAEVKLVRSHVEYVRTPEKSPFYIPDVTSRYYSNTEGMTYYYSGGKGAAVFDYDTSGLDYYDDDLGARIYLNADGTTPVPRIYNSGWSYNSFDEDEPLLEEDLSKTELGSSIVIKILPVPALTYKLEAYYELKNQMQYKMIHNTSVSISLLVLAGILTLYVVALGGYDAKEEKFVLRMHDRRFGEIYLAVLLIFPFFGYGIYDYLVRGYNALYMFDNTAVKIAAALLAGFLYMVWVFSLDSILNRFKCRNIRETFFTGEVMTKLYQSTGRTFKRTRDRFITFEMVRDDVFTRRFLLRLLCCAALCVGTGLLCMYDSRIIAYHPVRFVIMFFIVLIAYIFSTLKDLRAINDLYEHISRISGGDYTPYIEDKTSVTYGVNLKLNNISDGIQTAVDEQLKSERMKIELVTNVSHDLKTPLTSIISYVDLLSKEELPPEAADYVAVLEQKTARLKSIVSDVFDLAKATSNTDVNIERIDAVILINQVLADMEDRVKEYRREIKAEINADNAFIMAEGKKMYRVLQNIFDNSLKYSLSGTRIFAKLWCENGKVHVNVKNTASYEMTFTPEEIAERFTRGDRARTTEGSGLGLSIAKSFTEACGGKFDISIDGDLFMVDVIFDQV